jgi:hypothetical protein
MIKSCVKNIKYDDAEKVINAYIGNYYWRNSSDNFKICFWIWG